MLCYARLKVCVLIKTTHESYMYFKYIWANHNSAYKVQSASLTRKTYHGIAAQIGKSLAGTI